VHPLVVPEREPVHARMTDYLARKLPGLQTEAEELGVRDVRWLDVVETVNAVKTAGYQTVRLAQVRVRSRNTDAEAQAGSQR